jgi:hypothetical protein
MTIDPFKLPTPCRSGQLCQLCRDTRNPAGETFRQTHRDKFPQMYGPGFVCNFGMPWELKGVAPWAREFTLTIRSQMQEAAADQVARSATFGPGDVVKLALARMGYQPHPGCGCDEFRDQMNAWGWRGCLRRRREIVEWFISKSREHDIDVTDETVWSLVRGGMKDLLRRRRKSA